jgi:hypothetical protein
MQNLYIETMEKLRIHNKTVNDIVAIQGGEFAIDIDEFFAIAKNTNYDDDFGTVHIATDLVIIGEDWWMERVEYDGAENWAFRQRPKIRTEVHAVSSLGGDVHSWPIMREFIVKEGEE